MSNEKNSQRFVATITMDKDSDTVFITTRDMDTSKSHTEYQFSKIKILLKPNVGTTPSDRPPTFREALLYSDKAIHSEKTPVSIEESIRTKLREAYPDADSIEVEKTEASE